MDKNFSASINVKVPFYDVDPMHIVWYGNYVKYFEVVRCELLNSIDYGYREMERSGYSWPVVDLHVRYIKSAILGQVLICTANLVEYENRLKIAYEIHCAASGDRLTKGHSVQVAVSLDNNEMQFVSPRILFEKLGKL